ncbi:MAG TPA: MFS transporter [Caulobacteraceae bacterium]|nr:MFS transporter [Caulobacteraceae bacterium]
MSASTSSREEQAEAVDPASPRRTRLSAIVGGSVGSLVEWYDWYVYPSFALHFAKAFFPRGDQTAQLLGAATVFAVGFLTRPIGGWLMGRYADRVGRRPAMILSMVLMAVGSAGVGFTPTYAAVGVAAPALLTLARFIQGLSLGGQYGASATYLSEAAASRWKGFWTSFHFMTLLLGLFLAMGILLTLQHSLSRAALAAWGWRIPFWIGAGLALGSLVFTLRAPESDTRSAGDAGHKVRPWRRLWTYRRAFLIVFFVTAAGTIAFQTYVTYMPKFLVNTAGFSADISAEITLAALIVYTALHPLFGWISDLIGRRAILLVFGALGMVINVPLLSALAAAHTPGQAFVLLTIGLCSLTPYSAVSAIFKAELFPNDIRAFAVGLSFALSVSVFGGTAELVALSFKSAGREGGFYWYVAASMAVALVAAMSMPRKIDRPETGLGQDSA